MPILELNINNKSFEVECKDGEEVLLRAAEKKINLKLNELPELNSLPESKKFLIISLIFAGESTKEIERNQRIQKYYGEIEEELMKLENLFKKKD